MGKVDTHYLADEIRNGRMSLNELTRKQRKAVMQSMSVSEEVREHQRETQISKNQYTEIERPKPKNRVKAEKVGWDWGFDQQGFRHLVDVIEGMFQGTTKEVDGYIIHKVTTNEAVLYEQ